MKRKVITLREWLDTIDVLSEPRAIIVRNHGSTATMTFASFNEVRRRINPYALEFPIHSVCIGKGEDGIVITLDPPKEYNMRIGK